MPQRSLYALALAFLLTISNSYAQNMPTPAVPIIGAKSYLVIDSKTGHEIAALNPDEPLAPASLTKIMTTYVVYNALQQGSDRGSTIS